MSDLAVRFPFFRFAGSHREVGRQFGDACGESIRRHRDLSLARLNDRSGIGRDRALAEALKYRPFVIGHAPFFDEEIQGLAEGAGLSLGEAYLLQLRAELAVVTARHGANESGDECTTFAVLSEATSSGVPLVGQNADLPCIYAEIGVVVELVFDDMPSVLMFTPAGQVSYIGINDRGLGVFANFLTCAGWGYGFPRYLLSRLALTKEKVDDAIAIVRSVPRASSRNLMLLDSHGVAVDLETTPTRDSRLDPEDGLLAHANHYVATDLLSEERSPETYLPNTRARHARMSTLLRETRGTLNANGMREILRDRACHPNNLCRDAGDDPSSDTITFASLIAEPSLGRINVAVGPPHKRDYYAYAFTGPSAPQTQT